MTAGQLHAWFGISGGASTRAATTLRALGISDRTNYIGLPLVTTRYLVSDYRKQLLERRLRFEAIDW